MMTLVDIQEQLEQLGQQIIKLLEEHSEIAKRGNLTADEELEIVSMWVEEAAERGLDEARMERIAKSVIALSRSET